MNMNPLFLFWRADEVAECMRVDDDVRAYLWGEIVPVQDTETLFGDNHLSSFWDRIPEGIQEKLNAAAEAHRVESDAATGESR